MEDGTAWGELLETLPESVSANTKFLVVLEAHSVQHDENQHWTECKCGKTTEKVNHNFVSKSKTEATCTEAGEETFACACGYEKTDPISALSHDLGDWTSDDTHHWKKCSRCPEKLEKAEHAFVWGKGETAYEKACSDCKKVSKSLAQQDLTKQTLTSRLVVVEGESNAVTLDNAQIKVVLSVGTGANETSAVLDKKYEEFVMSYHFNYLSPTHTGERYADVRIGNYSVRYNPYSDQFQVLSGTTAIATCYDGALSRHPEIDVEIKLLDGKLSILVDGELLMAEGEDDCTVSNVTGAQVIGVYASRVQFELSNLVMYNGTGVDRIEKDVYDSAKLRESAVTCPEYSGNSISLENDKIKFTLSQDTAATTTDYDATVTLGTAYKGNFEVNFDLTYEVGHTQKRFIAITIGGVTFRIEPSEEKVIAYRGSYDTPQTEYATNQNMAYMSGKITIRLENGNIYFFHNGNRLAFNGNTNFYFDGIDSSEGLNIVFSARRLNLEISNLSVTKL